MEVNAKMLSININNEDIFEDLTTPFEYVYPETEIIGGIKYIHVFGGVYQAEHPVELDKEELKELLDKYWDLTFYVKEPEMHYEKNKLVKVNEEELYTIYFAYSEEMAICREFVRYILNCQGYEDIKAMIQGIESERIAEKCSYKRDEENKNPKSQLCHFKQVDKEDRYKGYLRHIQIGRWVGYLTEPGIYYFPQRDYNVYRKDWLIIDTMKRFKKEVAVIAYATDFHPSFDMAVDYLAIGRENFVRLKEIQKTLPNSFIYEFKMAGNEEKFSNMQIIDIEEVYKNETKVRKEYIIEEQAREIFPQIGFKDICLSYKYIFHHRKNMEVYDIAYFFDNKLILVKYENNDVIKKECDLRLLEELIIRKKQMLKAGFVLERDIPIIKCKEEKEKELLNPEAYELWKRIEAE